MSIGLLFWVLMVLWVVFWLSQAYFVLTPANRAPQATNASRVPDASIRPQPVSRRPGSMPRMRIGGASMRRP